MRFNRWCEYYGGVNRASRRSAESESARDLPALHEQMVRDPYRDNFPVLPAIVNNGRMLQRAGLDA